MTWLHKLSFTYAEQLEWDAEDRTAPNDPDHPREQVEAEEYTHRFYDREQFGRAA
jgi:hypothetical protein